mmetsp:Transcript_39886/g.64460  ORF Transcript_39886/g.64460 Transcript_39886/m.64460 type:complete len:216 (+) Transcript_39886:283-930(+)
MLGQALHRQGPLHGALLTAARIGNAPLLKLVQVCGKGKSPGVTREVDDGMAIILPCGPLCWHEDKVVGPGEAKAVNGSQKLLLRQLFREVLKLQSGRCGIEGPRGAVDPLRPEWLLACRRRRWLGPALPVFGPLAGGGHLRELGFVNVNGHNDGLPGDLDPRAVLKLLPIFDPPLSLREVEIAVATLPLALPLPAFALQVHIAAVFMQVVALFPA